MRNIIIWGVFVLVVLGVVGGIIYKVKQGNVVDPNASYDMKITPADHVKGSLEPKITIVEYSDFECPACAVYAPLVDEILKNYASTTKIVYRNFPLEQHKNAKLAAYVAEASGMQGKYWEMHDELFNNQATWSESGEAFKMFGEYAEKIGLDLKKFAVDVSSEAVKQKVEVDSASGKEYKISYTPTFFLNGKRIDNPAGYDAFQSLIENATK